MADIFLFSQIFSFADKETGESINLSKIVAFYDHIVTHGTFKSLLVPKYFPLFLFLPAQDWFRIICAIEKTCLSSRKIWSNLF